ncbi:MAG: response regulator [Lachnospiraceae bacterium]|jgi:YesN/AraC family two-component response regulator|nr:response regulator [Lachnospiraceae bacterium]
MYKVVFVDDEEQNLLLMEKIIDWEELGFRVSGMALDGDEGLEMYREIQPDLMLVDIKMDEMDGLSLIRKLREEYRAEETLFIIVTAYDEFSYAQQAIRLNVENYLLKPLERQKMAEMIRKIKRRLDKEKEENMRRLLLGKQQNAFLFEKALSQLWETFIRGEADASGDYGLENVIAEDVYRSFILFSPEEPDEKLLEIVENWDIGFCFRRQDGIFGVVRESDWCLIEEAYQKLRATAGRRRYMLQANGTFSNENEFARSIQQCVLDRYTLFYEEKSGMYYSGEGEGMAREYEAMDRGIAVDEMLKELLYQGKSDISEKMLAQIMDEAKKRNGNPGQLADMMLDMLYQLKIQLTKTYMERAFALLRHQNFLVLYEFHTSKKLQRALEQVFRDVAWQVQEIKNDKGNHSTMDKIVDYIQKNYWSREFSATEAAEAVSLSRNYLLKIFKEEKGISFWDYVTQLRMEKAKELLKNTDCTIYSISLDIGYESQYHFSRKFKSLFGISPVEFRNL